MGADEALVAGPLKSSARLQTLICMYRSCVTAMRPMMLFLSLAMDVISEG
jgi:hypothetical protein